MQDTGWRDVYVSEDISIKCRKRYGVVYISGEVNGGVTLSASDWKDVTTLPSGFRPDGTRHATGYRTNFNDGKTVAITINPSGVIKAFAGEDGCSWWAFQASFPEA